MVRVLDLMRQYERGRRFWRHVEVGRRDECWPWRGRPARGADLHVYELMRGPLPAGTRLVHRCGHEWCVNPDHMDVVRPRQARQ